MGHAAAVQRERKRTISPPSSSAPPLLHLLLLRCFLLPGLPNVLAEVLQGKALQGPGMPGILAHKMPAIKSAALKWLKCRNQTHHSFPGCQCRSEQRRCRMSGCPCYAASRECDPDHCLCGAAQLRSFDDVHSSGDLPLRASAAIRAAAAANAHAHAGEGGVGASTAGSVEVEGCACCDLVQTQGGGQAKRVDISGATSPAACHESSTCTKGKQLAEPQLAHPHPALGGAYNGGLSDSGAGAEAVPDAHMRDDRTPTMKSGGGSGEGGSAKSAQVEGQREEGGKTRRPGFPEQGRGRCGNTNMLRGKHARLRMGISDVCGWGLFSADALVKDDFIYEYMGTHTRTHKSHGTHMNDTDESYNTQKWHTSVM